MWRRTRWLYCSADARTHRLDRRRRVPPALVAPGTPGRRGLHVARGGHGSRGAREGGRWRGSPAARLQVAGRRWALGAAAREGEDAGDARDPDDRVLHDRERRRGDEAGRVPLREQALQPRRGGAAGREGARDRQPPARGPRAAQQSGPRVLTRCHHRRLARDAAGQGAAGPHRDQPGLDRAADGRDGHGQGSRRQGHSLQQQPCRTAVREHHVLGAARAASRERAVRARARSLHRRQAAETWAARDRRRRYGVSRRDRRDGVGAAGQAAAVPRGAVVQARGRPQRRSCRRAGGSGQ